MSKKAIITGASGQDSLLLSQHLLKEGYSVYALARRVARPESRYVIELLENKNYQLLHGDVTDVSTLISAIKEIQPDEFYNLAAQSHVGISFKEPISTVNITGMGVLNCLEAIRQTKPDTRFYQASSSEMFGGTKTGTDKFIDGYEIPKWIDAHLINENTPLEPKSPYGCAKVLGHTLTKNYREAYGLHASCGILFNHESELRKTSFVTRKVTAFIAKYFFSKGEKPKLKLGALDFARDWGCAKDYVRAMHLMLQQDKADDYIIATGKVHTGEELLQAAFSMVGLDWKQHVELETVFTGTEGPRPSDVKVLIGDATKAKEQLGWHITRPFEKLIRDMVYNDLAIMKQYGEIDE